MRGKTQEDKMEITNKHKYIFLLLCSGLSVVYYLQNKKMTYLILGFFLWGVGSLYAYMERKEELKSRKDLENKYFGS